jgi:hypothetical protein
MLLLVEGTAPTVLGPVALAPPVVFFPVALAPPVVFFPVALAPPAVVVAAVQPPPLVAAVVFCPVAFEPVVLVAFDPTAFDPMVAGGVFSITSEGFFHTLGIHDTVGAGLGLPDISSISAVGGKVSK